MEKPPPRRDIILEAAIRVFGQSGYRKTSVDDLAEAAQISKQGLYLHFSSKEEVFRAALQKYLDDRLALVEKMLTAPRISLFHRLLAALDSWFGEHLTTFTPQSFDVIEAGTRLSEPHMDRYKLEMQSKLATALADSAEFERVGHICSPREVAQVLLLCGLTWKEGHPSRVEFVRKMGLCIQACCQVGPSQHPRREKRP